MAHAGVFDMSMWANWFHQFASSPSNVIAAAAVVVSLVSVWATSRHGRLSVLPAFSTWAQYPSAETPVCRISAVPSGVGPA